MILDSIELIESRMQTIHSANDFVKDAAVQTMMDSICMRFQFIGEYLKKIEKQGESFLSKHLEMDLSPVVRFRDLIAHHYEKNGLHDYLLYVCASPAGAKEQYSTNHSLNFAPNAAQA